MVVSMQIKVTLFAIVFGFAARAQAACSSSAIDASYNSAFAACGNIPLASLTLGGDGFNSGAPLVCNHGCIHPTMLSIWP